MKRKIFLMGFGLSLSVLLCGHLSAQNEQFKALFIFNFTKFIEWPNRGTDNFVIAVLGNDLIIPELQDIASKKTVGTMKISVLKVNSVAEIGNCHIFYIPPAKSTMVTQSVEKLKGKGALIISDKINGCAQGAGVNFVDKSGKLNFEISKTNIEKEGLKVRADLLSLGIPVN